MTNASEVKSGQAVSLGYGLEVDGRTYRYPWLYVVAVMGDTLSGVLFDNYDATSGGDLGSRFHSLTRAELITRNGGSESLQTHPLTVIPQWVTAVAGFLSVSPDQVTAHTNEASTTRPPVATEGDMIPRAEVERWKARAEEIASEYAENNDLCGEFERCMEAIGLQSRRQRERTYTLTVSVPVTEVRSVTAHVSAYSEDEAVETFTDSPTSYLYLPGEDWDADGVDVTDVEVYS